MSKVTGFLNDNLCPLMVVIGCALGIFAFFIDWETFIQVSTDGWSLAFGHLHDLWFPLIGADCYIPLAVLIFSVVSICALAYAYIRHIRKRMVMVICTACGAFMLFSMTILALTAFEYEGKIVYFANHIGLGTSFAWLASVLVLVGGGMYVASHGRNDDG